MFSLFLGSNLNNVTFDSANLQLADLTGSLIANASISNSDLRGAKFILTDLSNTKVEKCKTEKTIWKGSIIIESAIDTTSNSSLKLTEVYDDKKYHDISSFIQLRKSLADSLKNNFVYYRMIYWNTSTDTVRLRIQRGFRQKEELKDDFEKWLKDKLYDY